MTNAEPTVENFFDNVGGGGSPSAKLSDLNDWVSGEIVDQRTVDVIEFGKTTPELNKDGSVRKQLVVTLQTEFRGWQGVSKVPFIDKDDHSKGYKPADQDEGKRAVYLPQWSNIQSAVAETVRTTNGGQPGPLRNGGTLAIQVMELKDTGKGNPLKIHKAQYTPPSASAGFFDQSAQQAAPQAPPAPPAPQQAPPMPPAPAAPAPSQPVLQTTAPQPVGDPWATPASSTAGNTSLPPF